MNFYKFLLISILFLSAPLAHASVVSGAPSSSLRNGLVGYWTMDGKDLLTNVADKSGKGNTGYIQFGTSGNKATSTAKVVGKIGQAMKFDGVNDYVKVNDATGLSIGEQTDYSFFAWMKNLPPSAGEEEFVGKYASANYEYKFGMDLSNTYLVFQAWNLAGTNLVNTSSSALGAGIRTGWHYVGFVKNGGNVQFYYDGVQKGSTNFTDSTGNGTAPIVLGARDVTPTSPFSGIMDDTRIYNRALSATEIKKLYTMGATKFATSPSTGSGQLAQGLVGWWTMDGKDLLTNVADKSGSGNTGYMQGFTSTSSAKVAGKVGQAVKFNGTSNYVLAPTAPTLVVPYSMALWFYPTKFGVNNNLFFPNTGHEIFFGTGNIIEIDSYSAGTFRAFCNKTFTATDLNKWQYITIIINSTTDASQWKCYLNGASIGVMNPNSTGTYSAPGNTNWRIGASNLSNHFFNGSLDDIRIYNRALSASEIKKLYTMGATKFAAPTSADNPNLNSGLVGWWTMDGKDLLTNVADKSGSGNTGYMQGFTSTSSAKVSGKIGQALKFDGVDDYTKIINSSTLDNLQNNTVSAWIYPRSQPPTGSYFSVIAEMNTSSTEIRILLSRTSKNFHVDEAPRGASISLKDTGVPYVLNQWQHVVLTSTSGATYFYFNGVQTLVSTVAGSNVITGNWQVGARDNGTPGLFFNGFIDDVRIYNRALSAKEVKELYLMGK